MPRMKLIVSFLLCCAFMLQAETVSITGTVRKMGTTTGLLGVKVSLAKIPTVTTTTNDAGGFTLAGTTSIAAPATQTARLQFAVKGNIITFTAASSNLTGRLEIFSSNGKIIAAEDIKSQNGIGAAVTLPDLSPGLNIMQLTVNGERFTRTLMSVGDNIFLYNAKNDLRARGEFTLAKQAAAAVVDTIVASKAGFTTIKVPIDNYTKQNIAIELDSITGAGGKCTRSTLQELVNGYLAAIEAGDSSKMPLAANAKYIENMKASSFGKGIWTAKIKVSFHRDFFDVDSCSAYVELMDSVNTHAYNVGAQIRTADGKITEITALVADSGDWSIKGRKDIAKMVKISSAEKWTMIPAAQQNTRAVIQAAGDAYLDDFLDSTKVKVPWGNPCARLEGSMYTGDANNPGGNTGSCNVGVPQKVDINNRHYVIDVDMGTVDVFCKFGGSMPDSHLFRVEGGKLRYAHTISIQ